MHCGGSPFGCRICDDCRFRENGEGDSSGAQRQHTCPHPRERHDFLEPGHERLMLPDLGVGRQAFEKHGQTWGELPGGQEPLWSIREQKHVNALKDMWEEEAHYFVDPRELIKKVYVDLDQHEDELRALAAEEKRRSRSNRGGGASGGEGGGGKGDRDSTRHETPNRQK